MTSQRKEYYAKGLGLNNVDARVIGPVLSELAEQGPVSARGLVEAARSTNSPVHSYFEWDDKKAADSYRIGQARNIIKTVRVRVISQEGVRTGLAAQKILVAIQKKGGNPFPGAGESQYARIVSHRRIAERAMDFQYAPKDLAEAKDIIAELRRRLGSMQAPHKAENLPVHAMQNKPARRFDDLKPIDPENVMVLARDHPAVVEGRTLFPSTVISPADSQRLLVSGANSRKLGDRVAKGPWSGFPIYQLTLEERATCPASCFHWGTCYGNGMQMARRHRNDEDLLPYIHAELIDLQDEHPRGFVVSLHVLGDFFSVDYVDAWGEFLDEFPALHVFGYTAWAPETEIGAAIKCYADAQWDRFAIRFSSKHGSVQGATTIFRQPTEADEQRGIVCPAQTGKADCCGSCGICWSESAKDKLIIFLAHGRALKNKEVAA